MLQFFDRGPLVALYLLILSLYAEQNFDKDILVGISEIPLQPQHGVSYETLLILAEFPACRRCRRPLHGCR